jgi:hypothetical protein
MQQQEKYRAAMAGQLPTGRTVKEIINFNWIKKITIYNV